MREILFRGKREDNGEWVYGFFTEHCPNKMVIWQPVIEADDDDYVVKSDTVCQYTGVKDKNGKMIFDGDILSIKDGADEIYRFEVKFGRCGGSRNVEHDVGYMSFYFWRSECGFALRTDHIYWRNEYNCEVIGNIFDNPELLSPSIE